MDFLQDIIFRYKDCNLCSLCKTRNSVVFGEGNTSSPFIMLLGEAPGAEEDKAGVPFVGRAGKKLDSIISFLGLSREEIFITNSVMCRPPNNRNPLREELGACRARLLEQIDIIKPENIICLGKIAYEQIVGGRVSGPLTKLISSEPVLKLDTKNHQANVFVTFHPSYHLRSPIIAYEKTIDQWSAFKRKIDEKRFKADETLRRDQ